MALPREQWQSWELRLGCDSGLGEGQQSQLLEDSQALAGWLRMQAWRRQNRLAGWLGVSEDTQQSSRCILDVVLTPSTKESTTQQSDSGSSGEQHDGPSFDPTLDQSKSET